MIAQHPLWHGALLYWLIYGIAIAATLYLTFRLAEAHESRRLRYFLPAAVFFPGLLQHNNFLSGNISFIFYGLLAATVVLSLRWNNWTAFYAVLLLASSCKTPWITLLVLPACLDKKQWRPACITAASCIGIFSSQHWIYPNLFSNFLHEVNRHFMIFGFGVSPAGLLAMYLFRHKQPFQLLVGIFYCAYASVVAAILWKLSSEYRRGSLPIRRILPVLLIGAFLLNPRIKDYDVAALTIAMALTLWRFCTSLKARKLALTVCAFALLCANIIVTVMTGSGYLDRWSEIEGILLVFSFIGGSWQLLHHSSKLKTISMNTLHKASV